MAAKKFLSNHKGQAVFEFIVFMPLLVFLFTIIIKLGNSINLSINQQKVTRRYLYQLSKNSSTLPIMFSLEQNLTNTSLEFVGMSTVAWRERSLEGSPNSSLAPCIEIGQLFSSSTGETCEEPNEDDKTTRFLRVFTAYGICGETYSKTGNQYVRVKDSIGNLSVLNTAASCVFR